jgi:hypothetical protein
MCLSNSTCTAYFPGQMMPVMDPAQMGMGMMVGLVQLLNAVDP